MRSVNGRSWGPRRPRSALKVPANGEIVRRQREIIEVADQLRELSRDRLDIVARLPYQEAVQADLSEAELRHYARVHGYKPGWVYYRLREQRRASP